MTYRSFVIHLDDQKQVSSRLELAARLAKKFNSHLIGLSPVGNIPLATEFNPSFFGMETMNVALDSLRQLAQKRAQQFRDHCSRLDLASFEAVIDHRDHLNAIAYHSHCSDLTIVGQPDPDHPNRASMRRLVEQVILHNARPTLVVPYAGSFTTIGDTVAIAWDDSREAARAVADALPILHKAQKVHLIQYESANDDITNQELHQRLKSVQQWLSWHGVEAEARLESPPANVGHALLAALNDVGADLLVMGAYGHTRWTERIFGGVTQTLLTQMTTPVLMSH